MVQMDNSFSNKNTEDVSSSSWESLATSKIVTGIDAVRTKTTGPAIHISRTVVYGLTMFLIGLISIPFLVIGTSRGFIEIFDNWVFASRDTAVWFVYLLSGVIWSSIGLFIWNKRPKGAATPKQKPVDFGSKNV
jgi:hypothetical protein